jgi:hypothetical protein
LRAALKEIGLTAYASGFSEASILAAVIAAFACAITYRYVRFADTAPVRRGAGRADPMQDD